MSGVRSEENEMINRILLLILLCAGVSSATQHVWQSSGSTSWNTAGNWTNGVPNALTDTATFTNTSVINCTSDLNWHIKLIRIRANYTGTFALGSQSDSADIDSIGSGGNVDLTGTWYITGTTANNYLKSTGTITTTGCNLYLGNNTFTLFISSVQTWLTVNAQAGSGKTNTVNTTSAQTYGALTLAPSGTYSAGTGGLTISPSSCPYTFTDNSRTSLIATGPINFSPSGACTTHINGVNETGIYYLNIYNTTSSEADFQIGDSIGSPYATNGFPLKSGTGALKLWLNGYPVYIGTAAAGNGFIFGNSNASGDDSIWCGGSTVKVGNPTSTVNNAGNTWLMMQTSNWTVGAWTMGSKTFIIPGTSSLTMANGAKGTITLGNATNSLYNVIFNASTNIIDSIAGTLRATNLTHTTGKSKTGPDSIILQGNANFNSSNFQDTTLFMRYSVLKMVNSSSIHTGTGGVRKCDSLKIVINNNMTMQPDSLLNIYQLIFAITGNVTYTQTAAKTLGYNALGTMSGTAGDTISYLSSSAGNRTYFQPPSAQAVTYATFKDFAAKNFKIFDTVQTNMDKSNDSFIVFRSQNNEIYNTPNTVTVTSCTPDSGLTTGGYTVNLVGTAFFGPCSLWVKSVGTRVAYSPSDSMHINNFNIPASVRGWDTIFVKNVSGSIGEIGFYYNQAITISSLQTTSGLTTGGTLDTANGTGFTAAGMSVTVGGTPATAVAYVSATKCAFTVPAGSRGAVNVVITNGDNQSATLTNGWTYLQAITASSITVSAGVSGTNDTIIGTGFTSSGMSVNVGGNAATGVVYVSATRTAFVIPAGSGLNNVSVTNGDAQTAILSNVFTYQTAVTISSSTPDTTVIESTTVRWQVTASGTAPITYLWYRNLVSTGVTTSTYSFTAGYNNNLDSFYCAVTNATGTTNSREAHLTVTANPPVISHQPQDTTVVAGMNAQFTVIATGSGSITYLWYKNLISTGVTTATYSYLTASANNGDSVYCAVSNPGGTTNTRTAHLVVLSGGPTPTNPFHWEKMTAYLKRLFVSDTGSVGIWKTGTGKYPTATHADTSDRSNHADTSRASIKSDSTAKIPDSTANKRFKTEKLYVDSQSTFGVKTSSNYTQIDTNGLVSLHGSAREFDDMGDMDLVTGVTNGSGHGTPTLTNAANGFSYYAFAIGSDSVNCTTEEKHRFVEGDSGHIQFMWRNNGVDGTTRTIKWSIHVNVSNPGDSSTYDTSITVQDSILSTDKSLKYHYNDIADWYVPNSKIGSIWAFQIKRVSATGAPPSNNPFGVRVGVHKKVDSFGSTGEITK